MQPIVLVVDEGVLYPALHRLEGRGLLEADWGKTDTGRRAKFYGLTDAGINDAFATYREQFGV